MSWIIKISGIILIVLSCFCAGFGKALKLSAHERDLKWYLSAFGQIKQKIRYSSAELPEIIGGISGCEKYYSISVPFAVNFQKSGLAASDEELIADFFKGAGAGDRAAEIERCNNYIKELEFRHSQADEQRREKTRLCRMLGVLGGIAVGIILI